MNSAKYNVYDSFLYKYKKFILAFTYTPGFNIQFIVDDMTKTFGLFPIMLTNISELNNKVNELLDDSKLRLETSVPGYYGQGILIYGINLPDHLMKFTIDLHLHFSLNLTNYLKLNPDSTNNDYNQLNNDIKNNKISKYYNVKNDPSMELNDQVFDKIIDFIEIKVYGKDYDSYSTKKLKEKKLSDSSNSSQSSSNSNSETEIDTDTESDTNSDLDLDSNFNSDYSSSSDSDLELDSDLDTELDTLYDTD